MPRKTFVSALLVVFGLATSEVQAQPGQDSTGLPDHPTFGERLDLIRRSLFGEPEPARPPSTVHRRPNHGHGGRPAPSAAAPSRAKAAPGIAQPPHSSRRRAAKSRPSEGDDHLQRRPPAAQPLGDLADPAPIYPFDGTDVHPRALEPNRIPRTARAERLLPGTGSAGGIAEQPPRKAAPAPVDENVLFSHKSPILTVETTGPRRVVVGKATRYIVTVKNLGDLAANDVIVTVTLPAWAQVSQARPSTGTTRGPTVGTTANPFQWQINNLAGHSHQELLLDIVPRESRPFELTVRLTSSPVASQATVEVQEPKLQMALAGPKEVVCGKSEIYRLSIVNPGTGDTENVVVRLLPIAPGDRAAQHRIGTIAAGDTKVVEIELAAHQGGQLVIKAEATADHNLKADAAAQVLVRQPSLQVTVSGPKKQYTGLAAAYEIRVRNPGDGTTEKVNIVASLPPQAEYLSATAGGRPDAARENVTWLLDSVAPGAEEVFVLKCAVKSPGENRIEVVATADGGLKHSHAAVTDVMALADLVLAVSDPPGPLPVGQEMIYEVRILNRGTKGAEDVEVVAFFSHGVEPVGVEGGPCTITPGTVVLKAIPSLPAGREVVYKIKARPETSGHHRFRVDLQCKSLGTKLTQEEATLFYADEAAANSAEPQRAATSPPVHTVEPPGGAQLIPDRS